SVLTQMIAFDSGDIARATRDTSAAMKIMAITGNDLTTTLTDLVPATKAFGLNVEQIGDKIIATSEKFGTSADDVEKFFGKISTVGQIAGASADELLAIGGNLSNTFGTNLAASADQINKIFDFLETNSG